MNNKDYIKTNKAAWEEAFDNKKPSWGDNNHELLKKEKFFFFNMDMKNELEKIDFTDKAVAQFCCNNGRELLSIMQDGKAEKGVGFDIAENILGQARETAHKAGITNCEFVACNILEIPESYHNTFDIIFFTIGATPWFEDFNLLFKKAGKCLKKGGLLLINDGHPFIYMLPFPGEEGFDPGSKNKFTYSYFKKEPWVDNAGMSYMSVEYKSKVFTSFTHTVSDYINGLSAGGMKTISFNEFDYDIGMTDAYNDMGYPLSFILVAEKC